MFALSTTIVVAALGMIPQAAAQLFPKPVLFADGLSPHVDVALAAITPANITSFVSRAYGTLPQACLDAAHGEGLQGWDMEVYEVTYADCPSQPWVFCRHHAAQLDQWTIGQLFGRLPVHERQWTRHVIALPGGGSAYAGGGDVVFIGNTNAVSVFQHEVGHLVDFDSLGYRASGTSTFLNAVSSDSCVPDDYSNSNEVEDFTQVGVLALYDIVAAGGLNSIGANWTCLANQKAAVNSLIGSQMTFGGTCTRRWPESPSVPVSARVRTRRSVTRGSDEPSDNRSPTTYWDLSKLSGRITAVAP